MKKPLVFLAFMVFASTIAVAQEDCGLDPFCEETDIPLDGGVSALVGAAAIYGVKKLREYRGRKN